MSLPSCQKRRTKQLPRTSLQVFTTIVPVSGAVIQAPVAAPKSKPRCGLVLLAVAPYSAVMLALASGYLKLAPEKQR